MTQIQEPRGLPRAFAELGEWLEAAGFARRVFVSAPPDDFTYCAITYARDPLEVSFESDRGSWLVDVRVASWDADDWFEPVVWHAYISGKEPEGGPVPQSRQAALVREDLPKIAETAADAPALALPKLRHLQEQHVLRDLDAGLD